MKTISSIAVVLFLLPVFAMTQEYRGAEIGLFISNGVDRTQILVLGIREGATSGLDMTMEESELPPTPPSEIFDVRLISTPGKAQLGMGSLRDYRAVKSQTEEFTETYTVAYQGGESASEVTLTWEIPYPSRIVAMRIESEDMASESDYSTGFVQGQLTVEVTFNYLPLRFLVEPSTLSLKLDKDHPYPGEDITITCQGDSKASWMLVADVPWLTMTPSSGEGDASVRVAVNTTVIPNGNHDAVLTVRSPVYSAKTEVPVALSVVVGMQRPPVAEVLELRQNYPNPFNPSTVILLNPGIDVQGVRLTVHDLLGREVADLSSGLQSGTGLQRIVFDSGSLPAGVYTYRLSGGTTTLTRRMTLLR